MALTATIAGGVAAQAPVPPVAGPALAPPPQSSIRVTPENVRFSNYLHDLASPRAVLGVVGGGVIGQLRRNDDMGLGTRIAEGATRQAVQVSVRHGLAALMHRSTDNHYEFCECRGFGNRVQHAIIETFTDRRDDGSRALSVPRIASTYAGGFASMPFERGRSAGDVLTGGTVSLGLSALFNIGRELTGIGR